MKMGFPSGDIVGQTRIDDITPWDGSLHNAIFMPGNRVVGDEILRLVNLQGQEGVSTPFDFHLQLHGNSDAAKGTQLMFEQIMGRPVTFAVYRAPKESDAVVVSGGDFLKVLNGGDSTGFSLFNGIAAGFTMMAPGMYSLNVKPALWKLTLTNHYRIHEQMNVRDVIASILDEQGVDYNIDALSESSNPAVARVQDWMQAGESDYAFIQRLMGKTHLYYYFVHGPQKHTVVFANAANYPPVYSDGRSMRYTYSNIDALGLYQEDVISDYQYRESLVSSAVCSTFTRQENAWEEDAVAGFQSYNTKSNDQPGDFPFNLYKIVQYGGSKDEVDHFTSTTDAIRNTSSTELSGTSHSPYFHVGYQFVTEEVMGDDSHPNPVRPSLDNKKFVLTSVKHQASLDGGYQNQFQATESTGVITPFSIQETHQGTVLAQVISHGSGTRPNGWKYYEKTNYDPEQDQYTDSMGDQKTLQAKGVFVRFSTQGQDATPVWIKLAPHMQTVPEIGVTVLVSRANDETELPEIQSIIQSNGNKVIMPSGWTANTHVGSNYSTSYGDGKNIRFGKNSKADLDKAVNIITNEYSSGQFRDSSYSQGAGYSYSTSEKGKPGILSKSESYGNTYSHQESAETESYAEIDHSKSEQLIGITESKTTITQKTESIQDITGESINHHTLTGTSTSTSTTTGTTNSTSLLTGTSNSTSTVVGTTNSTNTIAGTSNNTSTIAMSNSTSATGMSNSASATGMHNGASATGMQNTATAVGMQVSASATGMNVAGSVTGMSVIGAATGMEVRGTATGMSVATSATGMNVQTSATGLHSNTSAVGLSSDVSAVGVSSRVSAVGVSSGVSAVGVSSDVSAIGSVSSVSVKGSVSSVDIVGSGINTNISPGVVTFSLAGPNINIKDLILCL